MQRSAFRQVDLAAVVSEVANIYDPLAEEKAQSLDVDVAEHPTVIGNSLLIAQAVGNLVDNAVKYTPQHGAITLRLATRSDGQVAITVSDSGPGISHAEERTVERFYRGDASRGTPGVGLGLSLVSAVARLHNGTLEFADNHPGLIAALVLPTEAHAALRRDEAAELGSALAPTLLLGSGRVLRFGEGLAVGAAGGIKLRTRSDFTGLPLTRSSSQSASMVLRSSPFSALGAPVTLWLAPSNTTIRFGALINSNSFSVYSSGDNCSFSPVMIA